MSRRSKGNKLRLTSWNLPGEITEYYEKQGVTEMFPWQVQCLQTGQALQGGNLLYSAPTSAGKTLVAEILALKRILSTKRKAIFILPFISVAREKMFALRAMYSGMGLTVGGFMGSQTPPGGFKRVDIAVCTIERANSLINRLLESDKLSKLAVIVVDELHMVGDSSRGCLLEPLLTKVNFYVDSMATSDSPTDNSVQIIGMSATLPNMHVLSKWLKADLYCTDFRPVPLTEYVKIGSSILDNELEYVRNIEIPGVYNNDTELVVNLCLETIKEGKSVLIFCPSKQWCEKLSTLIAKSFYMIMAGKEETSSILSEPVTQAINREKILEVLDQLKRTPAGLSEQLKLCISYASSYHHAGLTMEEKDIIELAFRKSAIRVLVATTTLSSGVNLPAQRVIIRSPMFLGQIINTLTYKQMVGRAGRKGIDSYGESVLICKPSEKKLVQSLLTSDLPKATSQLIHRDADGNYILRPSVKRALLEMIACGRAKTVDSLNRYLSCTLLAAEVDYDSGSLSDLVGTCLTSLKEDEFINITGGEEGTDLVTPTQLGNAVFASSMKPHEALTVLCDLNKARKQFVLENELHMVYQVTPVTSLMDTIDWMKYLSLWESLPLDQQRVGELVGVSERFITLSHQGRRRRNNESQQRSLQIHKRFYTALVLHDLVNEMPLLVAEKKYGVNKGALQSLQQNAAIFAGMICTFCDKLGWTPLKLLLSDFQQRLDLGVRRELVDLIRIPSLDAKKARHFYDSGLHTVSEVVNSSVGQISNLLQTFLPFESAKQGFGETEWELKERSARRIFISSRKSLSITEAAQLIMEDAHEVFHQDLNELGVDSRFLNNQSIDRPSPSTPAVTPINSNSPLQSSNQFITPEQSKSNIEVIHIPPVKSVISPTSSQANDINNQTKQTSSSSITRVRSLFRSLKDNNSSPPTDEVLIKDSQESEISQSKYEKLLDHIEQNTNVPITDQQSHHQAVDRHRVDDLVGIERDDNITQVQNIDNSMDSLIWEDSFVCISQGSAKGDLVKEKARLSSQPPRKSPNLLDAILGIDESKLLPDAEDSQAVKRLLLSPDLTYTRLKKVRRIRTSTSKSLSQSSLSNKPDGDTGLKQSPITPYLPLGQGHLSHFSEIVSNKSQSLEVNPNTDLLTPVIWCQQHVVGNDKDTPATPAVNRQLPTDNVQKVMTPAVVKQSHVEDAQLHVTPINSKIPRMDGTNCCAVWSPNDNSLLMTSDTTHSAVGGAVDRNLTAGSNDLFSKSMDSVVWSPLTEVTHVTAAQCSTEAPKTKLGDGVPCPSSPSQSTNKPPIPDSPKISSSNKIVIVDVTSHPALYDSFLSDWSKATVYSLSLACSSITQHEAQSTVPQYSIGYQSRTDSDLSVDASSQLSTSTILSREGIILHQYSVVVSGIAVCLNSNTVFYLDLTEQQLSQGSLSNSTNNVAMHSVRSRVNHIDEILRRDSSRKVIFDSKEHVKRLASLVGSSLKLHQVMDPKVAMWLLDPADKEHSLIGVVNKTVPYLTNVLTSNIGVCIGSGSIGLSPHPGTSARLRACYESLSIMAMRNPLLSSLKEHGLLNAFTTLEMPHLTCLSNMEVCGFGFDVAEFNKQTKNILDALNVIEKKCSSYTKRQFDLGSHKDVGEVLFVELRLPYQRKKVVSRRGAPWSTAQAQLEKIKSHHPLPGLILLWRKLHSALKVLVHPLEKSKVWCEERSMYRVYSTCSIQTATGRITMHEPNLQTIRKDISLHIDGFPELSDQSISLRNVFTAPAGYTLISADYSQLELRLISHLASDSTLLPLLNSGGDVFKDIASRWKSVPLEQVTDEQRQQAKQICYGIIYGMGSKALSEQLLVDEDTAEQHMKDFQSTFIGLKKYITSVVESCRDLGYVSTIAGRRRYLPMINSSTNRAGRSQAERQAVNTTVQGSAADLVKLATINIHRALHKDVNLVLQIHDELIFEAPTSLVPQTAHLIKHTMESVAEHWQLKVQMTVRVKSGPTWAQLQGLEVK